MRHFIGKDLVNSPKSQAIPLIDFETADVVAGFVNDTYILIVSGTKPYVNMQVMLNPVIYVDRPEYWQIQVVGLLPGFGLPALAPYVANLDLGGVIGKKGIEVVGATKSVKIDVPPSPGSANIGKWIATIDNSRTKPQMVVEGTFPTNGEQPVFSLEKAVPQGVNPTELILVLKFGELVDANGAGEGRARYSDIVDVMRRYSTVLVRDPNSRKIAHIDVV